MAEEREALERGLRMRLKKLSPGLQRIIVSKLNMGSIRIGDTAMLADLRDRYLWLALRGGQKEAEEVIALYDELWRLMHNQPKLPESKGDKPRRTGSINLRGARAEYSERSEAPRNKSKKY